MDQAGAGDLILAEIRRAGPIPFSRFVETALYHPTAGFYSDGGRAGGRRGDFVTSVETGPLFAAMVGERLDRQWVNLGRPNPFRVAELGAGVGTLWRGIARAEPACFAALQWCLVERSTRQREAHRDLVAGKWQSVDTLPPGPWHAIVANELLDNLPFDIAEYDGEQWVEVRVGSHGAGALGWCRGAPIEPPPVVGPHVGMRVPILHTAAAMVASCRRAGDLVVMWDYGASTDELAQRGGWLRTYANHVRGSDPLANPGGCDITTDVAIDQLPDPDLNVSQAQWLADHGMDQRVRAARALWRERGSIGDLEAMFARSAVTEAAALGDPSGLGGFRVLEWSRAQLGLAT